jgi:hypothetical protein
MIMATTRATRKPTRKQPTRKQPTKVKPRARPSARRSKVDLVRARLLLDALIGRASYDRGFAKALRSDPQKTLSKAGMLNDKASVEKLQRSRPKDFDLIADAMIKVLGADFWAQVGVMASTCDPVPVGDVGRRGARR